MKHAHQIHHFLVAIFCIFATFSNTSFALFSDDFNPNTTETNPAWRYVDPYDVSQAIDPGETHLTFDGTNAIIDIPQGEPHDLWHAPNNNKAPRVLQAIEDKDFEVQVKFETQLYHSVQSQGVIVQEDDDTFLRFGVYLSNNTINVFAAYIDGNKSTVFHSAKVDSSPNFRRIIRINDQWIYRYSHDGENWIDAISFIQPISVTEIGFFALTTDKNEALLSSVDYFMSLSDPLVDVDVWQAPAPIIESWYQYHSPNTQMTVPGLSQQWVNVIGNVFSHLELSEFSYQLNNQPPKAIPLEPDRRLQNVGDFNIEIDTDDLASGTNQVVIQAIDTNGTVSSKTIPIDNHFSQIWPLPYTADWGKISDINAIESIAHVVDGKWDLTAEGIRTTEPGYDRIIAIGDMTWPSDYQVTVPFTVHSNFKGIGLAVGWQGHTGIESPKIEWPIQALAWVRGPLANPTLEIVTYGGLIEWEVLQASQPVQLNKDETYLLKTHSESIANGNSLFLVKFWQESEPEPSEWNLTAEIPTRNGSVILVAHQTDATFGNVSIEPTQSSQDGNQDKTPPANDNLLIDPKNDSGTATTLKSDDFNQPLDSNTWEFYDPLGDSDISTSNGHLSINLPAGSNHDLWNNNLNAPRIRQQVKNTDFDIEVKFDANLSEKYQLNGVTFEQDNDDLLRFDFYHNGKSIGIFSASFVNGKPTVKYNSIISNGQPLYMSIKRAGNHWSMKYSYDGQSWKTAASFNYTMVVNSVGLFAGNTGTNPPQFTSLVDYFTVK